ncbi:hypothetical protein ACFLSA_02800 [Bacteroidota bacterium]
MILSTYTLKYFAIPYTAAFIRKNTGEYSCIGGHKYFCYKGTKQPVRLLAIRQDSQAGTQKSDN